LDKKSEHIKTKNHLIYSIGDLVFFKKEVQDILNKDRTKMWLIKDYVNKGPEECSIYDYVLTDGEEDLVAIEFELTKGDDPCLE
tara:strand:+ start:588 stop:839 length:252 start_codon:yes stop_codon:yes gene_type:complete